MSNTATALTDVRLLYYTSSVSYLKLGLIILVTTLKFEVFQVTLCALNVVQNQTVVLDRNIKRHSQ